MISLIPEKNWSPKETLEMILKLVTQTLQDMPEMPVAVKDMTERESELFTKFIAPLAGDMICIQKWAREGLDNGATPFLDKAKKARNTKNKNKKLKQLLKDRDIPGDVTYRVEYHAWFHYQSPYDQVPQRLGHYDQAVEIIENGTLDFIKEMATT